MEEKTKYMTINEETAEEIENKMPEESELYDLADLFKVFGDSTRIKILYVLFENEMCVYDIASILNMTQSAISHQLRILKHDTQSGNRTCRRVNIERKNSVCIFIWSFYTRGED